MALGIPLPGSFADALDKGFNTGSSMFARIMHPILQREQLAQQMKIHKDALALQQAAAGRAAQLFPYQLQTLKDKHAAAEFEHNMMNQLMGNAPMDEGQNQSMPGASQMPNEEMGQGMGMFTPEGLAQLQQMMQQAPETQEQSAAPQNSKFNALMQNPMMRGWFKHKFGYDPLAPVAPTAEEKQASQFNLFKKKEEYKQEQEQKTPAAVKTLHENIIQLSPKAVKAIQHLIDIPSPFEPWGAGAFYSGQKASHHKGVLAAAENYAKAKGWPNTKGSIATAAEILERGNFETDFDYRNRLKGYQDELNEGVKESNKFLHPNKKLPESNLNSNVIEYERVNGKLVPKKAKK